MISLTWTAHEREIIDAVREELASDAAFNADYGKRVTDVQLEAEYPHTRIVVEVEERRPPLTLRWSHRYEIWDGSWDQEGSPTQRPESVAALLATDLMESTGAVIDCVAAATLHDGQRSRARLEVGRFEGCLRFYRDGLRFCSSLRIKRDDPPRAEFELGSCLLTLVAAPTRVPEQEAPRRLYSAAMFLRVASVETALKSLRPWGAVVGRREMRNDLFQQVLHVDDPDGNLLELTDDAPLRPLDS